MGEALVERDNKFEALDIKPMNSKKHSRKHSGGVIAPSPLKHIRAQSIIESSFTPATPMEFHPSISSITKNISSDLLPQIMDVSGGGGGGGAQQQWTSNQFKHFNSSIRGIDGGPRIIRTASEATSDRSLSYKIPTMVSQIWNKITLLLDKKKQEIPKLLSVVNKDLYPIIQEAMNDVAPIIKLLYNNNNNNAQIVQIPNIIHEQQATNNNNNNQKQNNNNHGKYLSMFGHGYDGDEDSSSDSDGSEIRRSIGIRHFPYINAMKQYCLTESRLYEFFLAFENLAIDQIFGDINIIFGDIKKPNNNTQNKPPHLQHRKVYY